MTGRISAFALAVLHSTSTGLAQETSRPVPSVQAVRITTPPELDGLVDEEVWKSVPPATAFVQQNPDEGAPATERTEVRVAFDERNLYFGIVCFDREPENIVVTQNRRDGPVPPQPPQ